MKLVPQSIKNLFNKLFRRTPKDVVAVAAPAAVETAAPAAVETVVETPVPVKPDTKWEDKRRETLEIFKSAEGVYTFDMEVGRAKPGPGGQLVLPVISRAADYYLVLMGNTPLAGTKSTSISVEDYMNKSFNIDTAKVFFKMKNENFYIDGQDAFTGLPAGTTYQIVVVPAGVKWKPPVYVPPARKALEESCPLISMPALPPYLYQKLNGSQPPKPKPGFGLK